MNRQTPSQNQSAAVSEAFLDRLAGSWVSQAISVAAKLGVADLIDDDGRSCAELAKATDVHSQTLYRLMRALASVGIFTEDEGGKFHSTPLAECLRTNS